MKTFALFFTRGVSLAEWEKIGSLEREIKPYLKLAESFDQIFLVTYGVAESKKYSKLFPENVEILSRPSFLPFFIYSFLSPSIHYRKLRSVAIIKTNQMDGAWAAVIAKKMFRSKLVVRCGYEWLHYLEKIQAASYKRKIAYLIEKFVYRNANQIIITSDEGKNFIKDKFKIAPEIINLIPNYIDVYKFKPLNLPKDKGRIIFVGRLDLVKNLKNLITAIKGLSAHLVIIGDGPLRGDLESLAKTENVKVEFKGWVAQDKLPWELNNSEIFILPSISEGNPKVLLEAMSCGLPCLGSDIESIKEIIKNGENGILAQTNVESIHSGLAGLLVDENAKKALSLKARQTIMDRFSFEKIISQETSLYNLLQNEKSL